jgi:hypothetical protein
MDLSSFQLLKNNARTNAVSRLHDTPIVQYGRILRVIDIQTVVCKTVIQTSLSREVYKVTLLNLSSALMEMSAYPKVGDTVLLLFLQRYDPRMFLQETVDNPNASGYNKFSGVGVLMSAVKGLADTVVHFSGEAGKSVADITSGAEWRGAFTSSMAVTFCRAVYNRGDERLIDFVFGEGRPYRVQHLSRVERLHGFWKDLENEWEALDAAVTERYSPYAPLTRDIQGAQTVRAGLGTDKDGQPVETEAAISETVHGKSPVARDIRSPQTIKIGIGNDESGDPEEQRDAGVSYTLGEKADVALTSKSGLAASFEKSAALAAASVSLELSGDGKVYIGNGVTDLCTVLLGIIDQIAALVVVGQASVDPGWVTQMLAQKTEIQMLISASKDAPGG